MNDGRCKCDELFASAALLLSRVTYEEFVGYGPTATETGTFGERMNGLPKFVATTLKSLEGRRLFPAQDRGRLQLASPRELGGGGVADPHTSRVGLKVAQDLRTLALQKAQENEGKR